MKKVLSWILGVFVVLLLVVVSLGGWGWRGWGNGCWDGFSSGWGVHGPGMMWGFAPFGWFGMIFMVLFPLGLLALAVLGIAWLVRAVNGSSPAPINARTCSHCGKNVQTDWKNCPYCGSVL